MEKPFEVRIVRGSGFSVQCRVCGKVEAVNLPFTLRNVDDVAETMLHRRGCALDGVPLAVVARQFGLLPISD